MKKFGRYEITVTSLSAAKVPDKLASAGISVLSARKTAKNGITFTVAGKDCEKVFAILRGTCYNIEKVRGRGLASVYAKCRKRAGLLTGALLFCALVCFFQTRVLGVEVTGNGAYYEREVLGLLGEEGVHLLSPMPRSSSVTAKILALPRVSFCELKCAGGILTVDIHVSEENALVAGVPLLSPVKGKVVELVVLRGTPLVAVGDVAEEGQTLVGCEALYADGARKVVAIARAKLSYEVAKEFEGDRETVRAAALLEFGKDCVLDFSPTEKGFFVSGTAYASVSVNLD